MEKQYVKLVAESPIMKAPGSPHVLLTCEDHPNLRWHCKNISVGPDKNGDIRYNGMRHIFFRGTAMPDGTIRFEVPECACPSSKLVGIEDAGDAAQIKEGA